MHTEKHTSVYPAVFVPRPTERESVAQGLFFGGSGRRVGAHTRPAFPKNAYGLVGIPLIRGASCAGRSTPSRKGVKAWGKAPPWGRRKLSSHRDTLGQIRAAASTAGRSATRQLNAASRYEEHISIQLSVYLTLYLIKHSNTIYHLGTFLKSKVRISYLIKIIQYKI